MLRRGLLALLAGGLATAAFPPLNFWPAALLALVLLVRLADAVTPRQSILLGWLFGFGHFLSGVWWVVISTHAYGGAPLWLALLMLLLLAAYLAVFPALSLWLYRVLLPATHVGLLLVWPAAWLLGEFGRNLVFDGFPWFSLGYLGTEIPGALKLAAVLGVDGLSALVALTAGALAGLGLRRPWLAAGAAISAWLLVWLLPPPVSWTRPAGEPLDVVLIQGNVPQARKWRPDELVPTMQLYQEQTRQAWPADLVIWPEVAIPAPLHVVEDFFEQQRERALEAGGTLFFTVLTYVDGKPYNTVYALGEEQGRYVKQHLVPFGEYIPTPDWMRPAFDLLDLPLPDIATGLPGDRLLRLGPHQLSMSICFEDVFPLEVRQTARDSALLVNVTNDAWFAGSAAPQQHLQIARLRAAESGRSLLRAANTGISAVIDPDGAIVQRLDWGQRGRLRARVQPRQGQTPYQSLGRLPLELFAGLALLIGLWRRRALLR